MKSELPNEIDPTKFTTEELIKHNYRHIQIIEKNQEDMNNKFSEKLDNLSLSLAELNQKYFAEETQKEDSKNRKYLTWTIIASLAAVLTVIIEGLVGLFEK